jgi:hypothetical protein
MIRWPDKDPSETLIYSLDLTDSIPTGDTVSTLVWAVSPSGPTVTGVTPAANPAKVKIAGGAAGTTYVVTCTATLTSTLVIQKSVMLKVRDL